MKASLASSSPKDIGGLNFVSHHQSKVKEDFSCLYGFDNSCSSLFFLLLFDFLLALQLAKVSTCSFTAFLYLHQHSRAREDLSFPVLGVLHSRRDPLNARSYRP